MNKPEFKPADTALRGYREMGRLIRFTEKAALFDYYGEQIWVPIKLVRTLGDSVWAPGWAVESRKEYRR